MQRPNPEATTLNDILITGELSRRVSHVPNLQAENQAMCMLIHQMLIHQIAQDSEPLMQSLVDTALELCEAGTTGLSLLETTPEGEEIFRWNALAGTLAHHVGNSTPRDFSPCGVCLDQGAPVLFSHPERYFTYFQGTNIPIVEGLILPLVADHHIFGTIWLLAHDEQRQFDSEDVRMMTGLADFTATALLLQQRQTRELLAANAALEAEIAERKQTEKRSQALISNLPGGAAFVVDRNLRYLLAEGEALATAGFQPEDLVGQTIFEVLPPDLAASYAPLYHQALAGESFEHEHHAHDRTYVSRGTPLYAANGEAYAVLVVSYDITDRKHAEEKLRRAAEMDAFQVQLSDALRSLADPVQIQAEACRLLGEQLGVDRAYYVEVHEAEGYARVNQHYSRGDSPSIVGNYRLSEYGWSLPIMRRGETIVITDTQSTNIIPNDERAAMAMMRMIGFVALPLIKGEVLVGALAVNEPAPREWMEAEIELVRETAEHTWATIERARAEAALRESEQRLSVIFAQVAVGLSEISLDGRFEQVNDALCQMLGRSRQELLAAAVPEVTHPEDLPKSIEALAQLLETGESIALDKRYLRPDGQFFWANSILTRLDDDQGQLRSILAVTVDLSDRKLAEANQIRLIQEQSAREEERQRAEALAELDRAKTLFFGNVSHEFRTPLTLSLAPLQDALKSVDEWEQESKGAGEHPENPLTHPPTVLSTLKHNLQLVQRNNLRLLKLVNTLLDFSRIEAGRMEAAYEPTALSIFTIELASVFQSATERAGLQLIVDCPPLPAPVYVDREMWEKIVLNLLSNALKFTFEGEIRVRLYLGTGEMERGGVTPLHLHTSAPQAILEICDTGVGIAPEHLPHLFERFYQVHSTQARTNEGSGIGLALVHELVQLHGGTIDVSSTVGKGTCFTISLPFGTDHLPSDRIASEHPDLEGDRLQPTRTLVSTTMRAATYVEEAERWLPRHDFGLPILDFGLESPDTASPDRNLDQLTNHPKSKIQNPKSKILLVDDNRPLAN